MKISWIKYAGDTNSFKLPQLFGMEVMALENLEQIDDSLKQLIENGYQTIIVTDEVASFSEDMIKTYPYQKGVRIIIAPR